MIQPIPAIDIIDGRCVRLTRGDYASKKVYQDRPADVAKAFEDMGYRRLHVVDLDGAKSKHIVNVKTLHEIATATSLIIDFGGGIKSDEDIETAFDNGASMVTVGSIAVTQPAMIDTWISRFGAGKIILGADVRGGFISINGWKEDSQEPLMPFLKRFIDKGITNVLCTEISRDGTLSGPYIDLYKDIMSHFPGINLTASGGVASADDIDRLDKAGIPSVVIGKAIYEGRIDAAAIARRYCSPAASSASSKSQEKGGQR